MSGTQHFNTTPEITWGPNETPLSTRFDDPYFSVGDGRAETREVFLAGNALPDRWLGCGSFAIAELGFGTGLNLLETLDQWHRTAAENATLRFVSFEAYPMSQADMARALSRWPELAPLADQLIAQWLPAGERLEFSLARADVTVWIGDARETVARCPTGIDAWYLDGFSPAKNPELWDGPLLQSVFDRTRPGGTFSTYAAAGWVRRNLIAAGFDVTRVPGHGAKRERLSGIRPSAG